jgi:hypothetical protein
MFKWVCLLSAIGISVIGLWMLADLKRDAQAAIQKVDALVGQEAKPALDTVNEHLPQFLAEMQKVSATLGELSEDVRLIKSVVGINTDGASRGVRSLMEYANDLQRFLDAEARDRNAVILVESVIGSGLTKKDTLEEFLVGLSKEMTIILAAAKSKQEVLYRSTTSGIRRKPFYIQFPDSEPEPLEAWIRARHAASADLPAFADQRADQPGQPSTTNGE